VAIGLHDHILEMFLVNLEPKFDASRFLEPKLHVLRVSQQCTRLYINCCSGITLLPNIKVCK
jgi:hypothetical protein